MTPPPAGVHAALRAFADAVAAKASLPAAGEAEEALRAPFEALMAAAGAALGHEVACVGEARLPDRMGKPDFAVHRGGALVGYAELKAPGAGADARRFKGRNRDQFKRFSDVPNMLYGDGAEWALYRGGERAGAVVRFTGDIGADAPAFARLLQNFLLWEPVLPLGRDGRMDLAGFAAMLAPLCRMLRDDVSEALADSASPLVLLARDWRQLLFPDATDGQFADSYAQTVTFALLLGRGEGAADPFTLDSAQAALAAHHGLLSRALQILTDPRARGDLAASLDLLLRVISAVPPAALTGAEDPWLHFYEDFLAVYDPRLRKDAGVYYTPLEAARAQVRLVDALLSERLGKPAGFADPGVVTLDPAAGTGTYLLCAIEHALGRIAAEQGPGAAAGAATELARNLYGFEFLVGPYAVSELRIGRALAARGAEMPADGARICLTDTLESPHAEPPQLPLFLQPIAEQRERALDVKSAARVLVCLGNPPYDRHEAARADNGDRTGSWVRYGNGGDAPILNDFLDPLRAAGHGVRAKNLYNLYVYFWRWALWKVFEHETAAGPGAVSFITASSWLDGDAFMGMREHMRRLCDEIWILDMGGEGRGTHPGDNLFAIRTPVAIAIAMRAGARTEAPARVRYAAIGGSRKEKLAALDAIENFGSVAWRDCPDEWRAPFRPPGRGAFFRWPLLIDLMPWQHSGVQLKRTWPIAPDEETLRRRWRALLRTRDRAEAFRETGDRTVRGAYRPLFAEGGHPPPIAELPADAPAPGMRRYAYRSFDRQYLIADSRPISRPRPGLWRAHGDRQVCLTSLLSHPLGDGPAAVACSHIPDLDHFRGSYGAKAVIPLYRDSAAAEANIAPGLLDTLGRAYGCRVSPEDFLAYVYGALAHPGFTARFAGELASRQLRVPITRDSDLFERVRTVGARLLWLHTYGDRFAPPDARAGAAYRGEARCTEPVPADSEDYPETFRYDGASQTLRVGAGAFAPVQPEVFDFQVSGLKVVRSWLRYRMKAGAGRRSSPLDDIRPERWTAQYTTELLELLWALEATVALYPEQARLLDSIVVGPCFAGVDFPEPGDAMRRPPKPRAGGGILR